MTDRNPYTHAIASAARAPAEARAAFLQRTYQLLLAGVASFAATIWAAGNWEPLTNVMIGLYRGGPLLFMVIILGAGFGVRMVAYRSPINVVAYFAFTVLFGLLLAPMVLSIAATQHGVVTQAAMVTLLVFSGLTAYVFVSGKDFSFVGGALAIGLFAMIGIGLAGWLFGFHVGLWYSVAGVLLFSGYILYDTSRVLHHLPVNGHVAGAIELFTSIVLLFMHVLRLLSALNRD